MDETSRRSICYMSLADAFITRLRRDAENRTKQRMTKGVSVEVLSVNVDKHDFIHDYLTKLHVNKKGTFSKKKSFKRQTIYDCERSSVCKGNSSGDPTKTRANGCSAYVSFMFEEGATITACVIRSRLSHCGHNPANREEARVNRIDFALKSHIGMHIKRGMKTDEIMNEIEKWNKMQGNTDHGNRRYFPSHQDIQQLALSVKKPDNISVNPDFNLKRARKLDVAKQDSIAHILRTEYRESCVYYQSKTTAGANPRPMILVLQNNDQKEMLSALGKQIVFIDRNYEGLYGYAIYVLVVRDNCGNGFPVSYIITSTDDSIAFIQALQNLRARCQLNPRVFYIEWDLKKYTEALTAAFPESLFLMSWFQVIQDVHKWLQNSILSNKEHADVRKYLLLCMQELKRCSKEEDLVAVCERQQNIKYEDFASMVQVEYLSCAPMWCDFGRKCICDGSAVGFKTESFFLKIKNLWLKGLHTRKSLEDVLKLIHNVITKQRNFVNGMMNIPAILEDTASDQAAVLLQQGWSQLVTWQSPWIAHVPSHEVLETTYEVNIITMECDCPSQTFMGPCMHLHLITAIVCTRDGTSPQQERHMCALEAFENCSFIKDRKSYAIFHNDIMCVTNKEDDSCTCIASAFDVECVGRILSKIAEGKEQTITYSIPPVNTKIFYNSSSVIESTKSENDIYGLKHATSQPKFTISVLAEADKSPVSKDLSFDISNSIVIQTHSRMEKDGVNNIPVLSKTSSKSKSNELNEVNDIKFGPPVHKSNSQAIIEKLYKWSKSNRFTDSKELFDALQNACNIILKYENEDLEVDHDQRGHTRNAFTNQNLRTTLRSVKRNLSVQEDLPLEYTFTSIVPSVKKSRRGRTIKAKKKSDFIT